TSRNTATIACRSSLQQASRSASGADRDAGRVSSTARGRWPSTVVETCTSSIRRITGCSASGFEDSPEDSPQRHKEHKGRKRLSQLRSDTRPVAETHPDL